MGFRFRRSARLGPLKFNFSKAGLSSISVGGRCASFNIPVSRAGGPRSTVGLPGTGLSWSVEHSPAQGLPNSRRLRPGQLEALKQELLALLKQQLLAPGSPSQALLKSGQITSLLNNPGLSAHNATQLALIETPEAMEAYLLRARSQDDARRRAQRLVQVVDQARRLAGLR